MPLTVRLLAAMTLILTASTAHALDVRNARSPEPPGGAPVMAGYMVVYNYTDEDARITGAASPDFDRVELHRTISENDTTRMEAVESIEVPAGGRADFVPRGLHLMLFTPQRKFSEGDEFPVTLETSRGAIEIDFRVIDRRMVGHDDAADGHEH